MALQPMEDPFVQAVRSLARHHRETKLFLEKSAERVAAGIRRNIDMGRNAQGFVAEGAPNPGGPMLPPSKATLGIRKDGGISSTRPYYATGHTYKHIGGRLGDATSIHVGGTTHKARRCIELNYGTLAALNLERFETLRKSLGAKVPGAEVPPRNPIGYNQKTADAVFRFWEKAFLVGDATHTSHTWVIPL